MKPEQYIREYGVDKAMEVVEGAPDRATTVKPSLDFKHFMYGICEEAGGAYILLSDLKRLVESVDMLKRFGGIELSKEWILEYSSFPYRVELEQAIADYESIYGGEHV
ncbi:hypothetical protein Cato_09 [Acinetobacter phage Cato]|nr:hypothetical protein Cato_09 [Acinetobacter phage Cato]